MRNFRRGVSRLEVAIWLLCAAAVGTAAFGVLNAGAIKQQVTARWGGIPFAHDVITILLIGVDEHSEDKGRADSIILVWANVREKKAAMLSIPRDTLCLLKGKETKIAHSYGEGGAPSTIRAVESLTGQDITYYVKVNFEGIKRIVDAMGGVEMKVENRMKYTDKRGKLFIDLNPGLQRLNGYNAMCYVRFRHDRESDFGRMRRQKEFLLAAFQQLHTHHSLSETLGIVYQAWRNLDTNFSQRQMLWLAQNMNDLNFDSVKMEAFPATEGYVREMSVLIPKTSEGKEIAWELNNRVSSGFVLDKKLAKVQVLNGTTDKGKALAAEKTLEGLGYKVISVGNINEPNYQKSKIFSTQEAKQCAEEMAQALNIANVFDKGSQSHHLSDPDIFLIVGNDWITAEPSATPSTTKKVESPKRTDKGSTKQTTGTQTKPPSKKTMPPHSPKRR
jgi:LCP family protein required for cell wall assembly